MLMMPLTSEAVKSEERMYGRKQEAENLERILQSVLNEQDETVGLTPVVSRNHRCNCQVVLVTGSTGSGKRTFVRSVLKRKLGQTPNSDSPFVVAAGRFHSSQRHVLKENGSAKAIVLDGPLFSAFDEAIQEIIDVVMKNIDLKEAIQERLRNIMNNKRDDMEILISAFPSIKRCLQWASDTQTIEKSLLSDTNSPKISMIAPPLKPVLFGPQLVAQQLQVRCPIIIRFLQAVASCIPVILLLEDLQYADESSLILIEELMNKNINVGGEDALSKGLLIIATSRLEQDVNGSEVFNAFLERCNRMRVLSDSDVTSETSVLFHDIAVNESVPTKTTPVPNRCFYQIGLSDLTRDEVFECVQSAPGKVLRRCSIQQQRELADLAYDHSGGNSLRLHYCLLFLGDDERLLQQETIHKAMVPESIGELYAAILMRQDALVQNVVRVASAIAQFGTGNVRCDVLEVSINSVNSELVIMAHNSGLLELNSAKSYVRFAHAELQQLVYDDIPRSKRALVHLEIGRRIWKTSLENRNNTNDDEYMGKVLLATLQLRNCIHLLVDFDERLYMAQLCFEAGQASSLLGDFHSASNLFEFAMQLLGPDSWRPDLYETSLVLHNGAAQAFYSVGESKKMEATLDVIFEKATDFRDKLTAYIILVVATGSGLKQLEAFHTACMVLRELGESVNQNPSTSTIIGHLIGTRAVLYGKSDSVLRNLPIADDADYLIVSQLLALSMFFSYFVNPEAGALICFRLVRLSLKKGMSGPSVVALSAYGYLLSSIGRFEDGYRYCQLACELVEKFEVWRPRVRYLLYGYTYYWLCPFRDCSEPLKQAQYSALKNGDTEVYAGSTFFFLLTQIGAGSSLHALESSARKFCSSLDLFAQKHALLFNLPIWGFFNDLLLDLEPLNLSGEIKDAATALKYAVKEGNKYVVGNIYSLQTMRHYLIGEYSTALQMAKLSAKYRQECDHILTFYEALAALAMAASSRRRSRRMYLNRGRALTKRVKGWARRCPDNFLNKKLLLEAETAALHGNSAQAISLFGQSVHKAKQEGFCHEEGIAYESLGRYQLHLGLNSNAMMSFESARAAFEQWGATAVVYRIDKLIESL